MLTYPWKCTVLHCNHLGNTWKPLVLMTRHFDYCPSASEGDNQSVRSSAPVVSRCFPGGYNVKLYISRGRLVWWLLAFLHSDRPRRCSFILGRNMHRKWERHSMGSLKESTKWGALSNRVIELWVITLHLKICPVRHNAIITRELSGPARDFEQLIKHYSYLCFVQKNYALHMWMCKSWVKLFFRSVRCSRV